MKQPKGMVADHWTWRDGKPLVTGWHEGKRARRGAKDGPPKAPDHGPRHGRGVVRETLFERMAKVQGMQPQPMSKNTGPSKRRLRELDAPKNPKRAKLEQGTLL